jgi:signal transduction histidine kinase
MKCLLLPLKRYLMVLGVVVLGLGWLGLPKLQAQTTEPDPVQAFAGWLDRSGTATVDTVQNQAQWEPFKGWKGWAYGPESVWLRIKVPSLTLADAPELILIVRPAYLDKVTFYDPARRVKKKAGDYLPAKDDALGSVLFTFDVPALTEERYVYLKLQSTSARMVHLSLMPLHKALLHTRSVEWATGFILVLAFIFLAWSLVHWALTRDHLIGIFALNQAIITLWGFTFFGFARLIVGPFFNEGTLSLVSSIAVSGLLWSGLWFFATLLKDYNARPWMLRGMQVCAVFVAGLSFINFFGLTTLALQITNFLVPIFLLWIVLTLWFAPTEKEKPYFSKNVLLVYLLAYAALHALPTLMHLGFIPESSILFLGNIGLLVLNGFVMLVILSVRQRRFKAQHEATENQLMLEQEQARLNQQYLDEQRQLLAMLAHEMKTPLANLRIWMEAGPKGRPVMERAIVDMDRVIERCVHAGQLSDQSLQPRNEWLDASELTQSVLAASRQPERVTVSLPSDVCAVHTDAQMLSIVLSNVLENAYKYSPPDSPIALQLVPHAGEHTEPGWRWTVENTVGSAGFPEADKVFDKYYRSAAAQRQSGSGLGLFLVKSLLELMRGQVTYTPLQERVRFEVWVPCDASKSKTAI